MLDLAVEGVDAVAQAHERVLGRQHARDQRRFRAAAFSTRRLQGLSQALDVGLAPPELGIRSATPVPDGTARAP